MYSSSYILCIPPPPPPPPPLRVVCAAFSVIWEGVKRQSSNAPDAPVPSRNRGTGLGRLAPPPGKCAAAASGASLQNLASFRYQTV